MDLKLFAAVLRRHKKVVLGGFLLGAVLAVFAYGKPAFVHGKPTIVPSGAETWQTQSQLLITQRNDPYGDVVDGLPLNSDGKVSPRNPTLQVGGVGYLASLSPVYAEIANGDLVQSKVHRFLPAAALVATPVTDPTSGLLLPVVQLTVTGDSEAIVQRVAAIAATTLTGYVVSRQAAAAVPAAQRVQLSPVQNGFQLKLVKGHKPTVPMLVFVAVLAAAISLAFVLENFKITAARAGRGSSDGSDTTHEGTPARAATGAAPAILAASAQAPSVLDIRKS